MAYMSKDGAAKIRDALKAEFPLSKGWKFSVKICSGNLGIDVAILRAPVRFEAWDYSSCSRDFTTPRCAQHAMAEGRKRPADHEQLNHYHFREHYTPESVMYLEKVIQITMADHWDKSDIQSDYFNCAFYAHFEIGGRVACEYSGA